MSVVNENEDISDLESSPERKVDNARSKNSKNPFLNFLAEFRKATTNMKLSGSQMSTIGSAVWKGMSNKQKERFQIVEARRRRSRKSRGVRKGGRSRRRRRGSRRRS